MDYKLLSSLLTILFTIFFIIKNSISFNPISFHCNNYVLNSYLYIILTLSIFITSILSFDKLNLNIKNVYTGNYKLIILLVSFILLVAIGMINPKYFLLKHLIYIFWIILSGLIIFPLYKYDKTTFDSSALGTLIIIIVLTLISVKYPTLIGENWERWLVIMLLGLFIVRLIKQFLLRKGYIEKNNKFTKLIPYITIILFSAFVLYDTKKIIINSKRCGKEIMPDYINESLKMFLNTKNIFLSLFEIENS